MMETAVAHSIRVERASVRPMPFWQALLYFGLPVFRISSCNGIPALARLRLTPFEAYIVGLVLGIVRRIL